MHKNRFIKFFVIYLLFMGEATTAFAQQFVENKLIEKSSFQITYRCTDIREVVKHAFVKKSGSGLKTIFEQSIFHGNHLKKKIQLFAWQIPFLGEFNTDQILFSKSGVSSITSRNFAHDEKVLNYKALLPDQPINFKATKIVANSGTVDARVLFGPKHSIAISGKSYETYPVEYVETVASSRKYSLKSEFSPTIGVIKFDEYRTYLGGENIFSCIMIP